MTARTAPLTTSQRPPLGREKSSAPEIKGVEAIVIVIVAAFGLSMLTEEGTLQVGRCCAPVGEEERVQDRLTSPENSLTGVTVIVDVLPVVAPAAISTAVPLIVMKCWSPNTSSVVRVAMYTLPLITV
jgi:hypothetical protein